MARRYLAIYLGILGSVALLDGVWFAWFALSPDGYYYRPWEYFHELSDRSPAFPPQWRGWKTEDLGRRHFFLYQRTREIVATTDEEGFRIVPARSGPFRVLFTGDSQLFGSGLSDRETIPWQLSERTGLAVFNGARQKLPRTLHKPGLEEVATVVEVRTERDLGAWAALLERLQLQFDDRTYQPPSRLGLFQTLWRVPRRRHSFSGRAWVSAKRMGRDARAVLQGRWREPMLYGPHAIGPAELDATVAIVRERHRALAELGPRYVFAPLPAKQTLYVDGVDERTRTFLPNLLARLAEAGLPAIDLHAPFVERRADGLFPPYDTHFNARGAALAAEAIACHLGPEGEFVPVCRPEP